MSKKIQLHEQEKVEKKPALTARDLRKRSTATKPLPSSTLDNSFFGEVSHSQAFKTKNIVDF